MAGVNDLVFEERVKIMLGNIDLAVGTAIPGRGGGPRRTARQHYSV
jgi:hypothetical protein